MLDANATAQLKKYLELVSLPLELAASLDDSPASAKMRELLGEIATLSPLVSVVEESNPRTPSFAIRRAGTEIERPVGQRAAPARQHRRSRHRREALGAFRMVGMVVRQQDGGHLVPVLGAGALHGAQMRRAVRAGIHHDARGRARIGQDPGVRAEVRERRRVVGEDHARMSRHAPASPRSPTRRDDGALHHGSLHVSTALPPSRTAGSSITRPVSSPPAANDSTPGACRRCARL